MDEKKTFRSEVCMQICIYLQDLYSGD